MWASCLKVRNMKSENAFDQYTVVVFYSLTYRRKKGQIRSRWELKIKKKKEENCELQRESYWGLTLLTSVSALLRATAWNFHDVPHQARNKHQTCVQTSTWTGVLYNSSLIPQYIRNTLLTARIAGLCPVLLLHFRCPNRREYQGCPPGTHWGC